MSGKSGENVTFCRENPDRKDGWVRETSIGLSANSPRSCVLSDYFHHSKSTLICCGWDGKLWSSHAGLSENKVTHVIACVVGADLSANSSPDYLDNHEYFAAKARSYGIVLFLPIISIGSWRGVARVNGSFRNIVFSCRRSCVMVVNRQTGPEVLVYPILPRRITRRTSWDLFSRPNLLMPRER